MHVWGLENSEKLALCWKFFPFRLRVGQNSLKMGKTVVSENSSFRTIHAQAFIGYEMAKFLEVKNFPSPRLICVQEFLRDGENHEIFVRQGNLSYTPRIERIS